MHFNLLDLNEFKAIVKGLAIPLCLFVTNFTTISLKDVNHGLKNKIY